ncbi:CbtA family protein [Rugamonas sp. CCM 8940]|uniref:CbtA family protein n=1 Tax=Rugamonas sp. CCM 8940 TaxID=2765359 RepID=UPI0018F76F5E|nr:CbtA family protein [Rugamonas sp. CCM 8940]MBJ7312493.1 CbtA family protein [Rugamonas sp. CCM 8940]
MTKNSPFNRIVRTAVAAGLLSGLVLTGLQSLQVAPIILQAETYEDAQERAEAVADVVATPAPAQTQAADAREVKAELAHEHPVAAAHEHVASAVHEHGAKVGHTHGVAGAHTHDAAVEQDHDHQQSASASSSSSAFEPASTSAATAATPAPHAHGAEAGGEHEHGHEHGGWKPENGAQRTFFSAVANISMAVAFGLLLSAAMTLRGVSHGWRGALLWGAAGYAVFFLAPSLGLPPEVPGTAAAPLGERQVWWLLTVAATAGGLALLALAPRWPLKLAGVAILLAPHLVGAPQPLVHASAAPAELAQSFIYATAFANAVFWLALGALSGFFFKKFN